MRILLFELELNQSQTCSSKKLINDHLHLKTCILPSFDVSTVSYLLSARQFFREVSLLLSHNWHHRFHSTFSKFLIRLRTKIRPSVHWIILHISFNNQLHYVLKRILLFLSNFIPSLLSFSLVSRLHEVAKAFKIV